MTYLNDYISKDIPYVLPLISVFIKKIVPHPNKYVYNQADAIWYRRKGLRILIWIMLNRCNAKPCVMFENDIRKLWPPLDDSFFNRLNPKPA